MAEERAKAEKVFQARVDEEKAKAEKALGGSTVVSMSSFCESLGTRGQ